MAEPEETYTPGYSEFVVQFMMRRTAATHASFFTPHLRAGMRLLDCGCGPGAITLDLAKLVSPGEVFGVDREQSQVQFAQTLARERGLRAQFKVASIYELPFPDRHFDAVFVHALFEHLREPGRALLEIKRVLKLSGLIGIRSPDWGGFLIHPTTPLLEDATRFLKEIQIANGGNVYVGRTHKSLLHDAGFTKILASASYECYEDPESIAEFMARRIKACKPSQAKDGQEGISQMPNELRAWGRNPVAFVAVAWCEAVGWVSA